MAYLNHPILGPRLVEITELLLTHPNIAIDQIMGWRVDSMKLRSSMTLFSLVSPDGSVFHRVLDHFFEGSRCPITMEWMNEITNAPGREYLDDQVDPSLECLEEPEFNPDIPMDEPGYETDDPYAGDVYATDNDSF
jgi:hypothetical protein